jgi:hypothetical protein
LLVYACSETYQYYTLPFCQHKEGKKYVTEDLGEVLEGDRLVNTPYDIRFREDVESQVLCTKKLTGNDLYNVRMAIAEDYYFQVCSWQHSAAGQLCCIAQQQASTPSPPPPRTRTVTAVGWWWRLGVAFDVRARMHVAAVAEPAAGTGVFLACMVAAVFDKGGPQQSYICVLGHVCAADVL